MELHSIRQHIESELDAVDQITTAKLHSTLLFIQEITQYILNSNGKRIRPMIVLLSAKACNYAEKKHIDLASSIELIHTATLLHDDVMDHATLRRGQQTVNTLWGNHTSVLMGDFLYSRAFRMIIDLEDKNILNQFATATHTLIEGEMLQLVNRHNVKISKETYFNIIQYKTAQLFELSAESGASLSAPPLKIQKALRDYGRYIGLAYQLIDDVLDYNLSAEQIGKNIGQDLADGKTTLPIIHAFEQGTKEEQRYLEHAIQTGEKAAFKQILAIVESTGGIQYTTRQAQFYAEKAKASLESLPVSIYKTALEELSDFVVHRTH